MKKIHTALALTTIAAAMSAANAQSITVFGVADAAYTSVSADGSPGLNSITSGGNSSSRFGVRGTEDLGGGLKGNIHLESGFNVDDSVGGTASTNNTAAPVSGLFDRRATVGLSGGFGEVRIGRDFVPSFSNLSNFHPFGTNGLGNAGALFYPKATAAGTPRTNVRASNSIGYFLPDTAGFTGHLMYALGESTATGAASENGNLIGARLSYASGPISASIASTKTKYINGSVSYDFTQSNFGASYQLGAAKIMYLYGQNGVGASSTTANLIGTQYDFGKNQIRAAYTTLKADYTGSSAIKDANQLSLGYVFNYSKRTAVYVTYSLIDNDSTGRSFQFGAADGGVAVAADGGNTSGYQVGIRHNF